MCSCCCTKILITGWACSKIDPIILVHVQPCQLPWQYGLQGHEGSSQPCVPLGTAADRQDPGTLLYSCNCAMLSTSVNPLLHSQGTCTWNWLAQWKGK